MKGITLCAECTYYDKKKHRCKRGASKERFAIDPFYDDCPLPDVVEVVRCKDCDVPHNRWIGCPNLNGLIPPPDFYCAYGKRKIDKEE